MRRVKLTLLLAVILAISLAPPLALRLFPRETSGYLVDPLSTILGSRTGYSKETLTAVWIVISFAVAIVTASTLLLVLTGELIRSTRESS